MPIDPAIRKQYYGRRWRKEVRPRILRRAGGRFDTHGDYIGGALCEQCKVPDRTDVMRYGGWWFCDTDGIRGGQGHWVDSHGQHRALHYGQVAGPCRLVGIILTIAHLDHTPGHEGDDNLRALCQWCHLNYDQPHHAETRATRKDTERPLLAAIQKARGER